MVNRDQNAPCPCGSGKKAVECCLKDSEPQSFTKAMVDKKTEELLEILTEWNHKNFDNDLILYAYEEFYGLDEDEELPDMKDNPYMDLFHRWFIFYFIANMDEDNDMEDITYPSPDTIGAMYLKENKKSLDSLTVRVIEAALNDPICFWQVTDIEKNRGVFVEDIFFGRKRFIEDPPSAAELDKGDIILASMQQIDDIFVFNVTGPFTLPADANELIKENFDFDEDKLDNPSQLYDWDLDLIDIYQEIVSELIKRQ